MNKHHKSFYIVKSKPRRCFKETNVLNLWNDELSYKLHSDSVKHVDEKMFTILHIDDAG